MESSTAVIHVVDDDRSFRTALGRVLRASGYRVACYESGEQLLQDPPTDAPGCLLLDVCMPGVGGLELQEQLKQVDSFLPVVFLTGYGDIPTSVRAMKAGAEDYLSKPVSGEALLEAVERALARYHDQRNERDRLTALQALVSALTPREREVYALVVRGRLNKQIAFDLGTTERTVKAHRHSVMQKLRVNSLAEAVLIAERLGMVGRD